MPLGTKLGTAPSAPRFSFEGYLQAFARFLRNERGDEIVAELRAKVLLQVEIREGELGRPLTADEQFHIFWSAMARFERSRHLAQMLHRKGRSS
jgi:hypothetical protein